MQRLVLLACMVFVLFTLPAQAQRQRPYPAPDWQVDKSQSSITFTGTQMGKSFSGVFKNFDAEISFDPVAPRGSYTKVTIVTESADTQDAERDGIMQDTLWFDVKNFPTATFESERFSKTNATDFVVEGNLTIRNVTLPVNLPFTLDITKDADSGNQTARMTAQISLDRSLFQLGQKDWADPKSVANNVDVAIIVVATSANPATENSSDTENGTTDP